jgi:protoporphyrinogen oxidase
MYFKPYNEKIWNRDLASVPLSWLEGKLPMPSIDEIIFNNFHRKYETEMVHSSFFYPKIGGSQFIADHLSENIDVVCNSNIESINYINGKWVLNHENSFDKIVYTGNIKKLPTLMNNSIINIDSFSKETDKLDYHGTTTVLCEIEENPYSWIYIPDVKIRAHRIICTGNFSEYNNKKSIRTATIEFTDKVEKELILENLKELPFNPRYITHKYTQYTYPIQEKNTRNLIKTIKAELNPMGFYLLGRFAEWEYYNMDTAIGAAMDLSKTI